MCWGCVAYDGAATEHHRALVLLTLCGLRASEVSHVQPAWVQDGTLVIPRYWPCVCPSCLRRLKNSRYQGGSSNPVIDGSNILAIRALELSRLGKDGVWLLSYIRKQHQQLTVGPDAVTWSTRAQGLDWSGVRKWGPCFLTHRYGMDVQEIIAWRGELGGVYTSPPFPGQDVLLSPNPF